MDTSTIILIGPEGAGKTTLATLLSPLLKKSSYELDRHRNELYSPYGYDKSAATALWDAHKPDPWPIYRYWKPFEFAAVRHILSTPSFHDQILSFGAGHSIFENADQLAEVERLMGRFRNVILVLPCEDADEAVGILEKRKGMELPLNKHFLEHESNRRLAKFTVYTKGKTPEETTKEVLDILKEDKETREKE